MSNTAKTEQTTLYLLYFHGFKSSCKSVKAQQIRDYFRDQANLPAGEDLYQVQFICQTYPQANIEAAMTSIQKAIELFNAKGRVLLIGSSLGGFFVEQFGKLYDLPYCMINPALNTDLFFDYIGEHQNPNTGEKVVLDKEYIEKLKRWKQQIEAKRPSLKPNLLLMDREDKVIDVEFANRIYRPVKTNTTVVFDGGSHDFEHLPNSWKYIEAWILQSVK